MREDRDRPLRSLALSAEQDVRTKFAWLCAGMRHHAQEMQNNVGRIVQQMRQHIATQQRQQQGSLSRLAVRPSERRLFTSQTCCENIYRIEFAMFISI